MPQPIAPRISKILSLPVAWVFLLAACAAHDRPETHEYAGRALEGKTLAIVLPDTSAVTVANPKELDAAFPRANPTSPKAVLAQEFNEYVYAELERGIDFVKPVRIPDSARPPADQCIPFTRKGDINGPGFTYAIPSRESLRARGVEADLVLVVQTVKSSLGHEELIAPKMGGSIKAKFLLVDGRYILWDYAGGKPICDGRFRPRQEYRLDPGTGDWMKAFSRVVTTVMEASPFRGAKWYNK